MHESTLHRWCAHTGRGNATNLPPSRGLISRSSASNPNPTLSSAPARKTATRSPLSPSPPAVERYASSASLPDSSSTLHSPWTALAKLSTHSPNEDLTELTPRSCSTQLASSPKPLSPTPPSNHPPLPPLRLHHHRHHRHQPNDTPTSARSSRSTHPSTLHLVVMIPQRGWMWLVCVCWRRGKDGTWERMAFLSGRLPVL